MNLLACSASVAFSPASAWVRLTHPSLFYCGVGINDLPLGSLSNFNGIIPRTPHVQGVS